MIRKWLRKLWARGPCEHRNYTVEFGEVRNDLSAPHEATYIWACQDCDYVHDPEPARRRRDKLQRAHALANKVRGDW